MKVRGIALMALLAVLVGLLPLAAAQDNGMQQINCLNLSEADCAIVQAANDNMNKINSAKPAFSVDMTINGAEAVMPGMGLDTLVNAQGSGSVVIDHTAMTKDAPYNGVSAAFDLSGNSSSGGEDQSGTVSIILVDGVLYWKDGDDWKGAKVADLMEHAGDLDIAVMGMPMTLPMGMSPGMMMGMMQGMAGDNPVQALQDGNLGGMDPSALLQIPGFIKQERLADEEMMGQTMQVFAFTGDIGTVLKAPEFQQMFSDAMTQANGGGNAQGGQGGAGMMAFFLPMLMESTTGTATLTRWVGADDQFLHQVTFTVDATVDLNSGSASSKATPLPPIKVTFNVSLSLADINDTAAPTAPEGATIVPADELFPQTKSA